MRENLDRVLQFMASKKIRMHQISSREILEGNLKAVMRLILALAAHYKPASVKHHDVSYDQVPDITDKQEQPAVGRAQDNVPDAKEERRPEQPQPPVKRSPSLNESHYGPAAKARLGTDPAEVFSQLERRQTRPEAARPSVETQTQASASRSLNMSPPVTGQGARGQEPGSFTRTGSGRKLPQIPDRSRSNTLPTRKEEPEKEVMEEAAKVTEEQEDVAAGRKPSKPKAMEFWESMENIERNDFRYNTIHRMSMGRRLLPKPPDAASVSPHHARSLSVDRSESISGAEAEKLSLNSSFSGPTSLPQLQNKSSDNDSSASHSPRSFHKIPADGASLQSQNSEDREISLDLRREVEGSSNNNSPPTSVIQGGGEEGQSVWELAGKPQSNQNPAYDWLRGSFDRSSDNAAGQRRKWGLPSPLGHEFNVSDDLLRKLSASKDPKDKTIIPYDVLLEDLSQAKRQLLELHNLECVNLEGSKLGLQTRLAEQEANISNLKQTLLRVTLAKQGLESEKKELARRLEEVSQEQEDRRQQESRQEAQGAKERAGLYAEELRVARDAISNLRSSFSDADPGQHILDTLEQCISVIVERMAGEGSKPGSRMSGRDSDQEEQGSSNVTTKIVYFTPRSVTPFMTSISRPVGRISLRDFKALFDRPGFYRYHFKTMDKEFGMVKEEIAEDDKILPGVEGKIVVWVEEE